MPSIAIHAIVLRHVNYRDNDRMLTLFSPTLGRVDAIARGCRKVKSPLAGATELFCTGDYQLHQSGERYTLTGCAIRESYYPLREDYERLVYGVYLLGLCEATVQPGEEHPSLFTHLLEALARLAYGGKEQSLAALAVAFLLRFAEDHGYRPQLDHCVHCGAAPGEGSAICFDALAGGVLCAACGGAAWRVGAGAIEFMRSAQRATLEDALQTVRDEAANEALFCMRVYLEGRVERIIKAARLLPQGKR